MDPRLAALEHRINTLFDDLHRGLPLTWHRLPEPPAEPASVRVDPAWPTWEPTWPYGLRKNQESWFAAELTFPERHLGCDLAGATANLFMYGYTPFRMWLDGEQAFAEEQPWAGTGPIVDPITTAVEPGRASTLLLAIRPTELPYPFDPLVTEIRPEPCSERIVDACAILMQVLIAAELAGPEQANLIERALEQLDLQALEVHDWERFMATGDQAEATLAPLQAKAQEATLHLIGHTHIDMDWKWTWDDTVLCARRDTKATSDLLRDHPEVRFSMSQIPLYQIAQEHDPGVFSVIRAMIATGQWENLAGTWVEGDLWMAHGETLARQALYAHRWSSEHLGQSSRVMWEPDTFGHPGNMPQLARLSGCDTYFHWRCNPGGDDPWPARWWEGIDGTSILTISSAYGGGLEPGPGMWQCMRNLLATLRAGRRVSHHIWGSGDHGGALGRYQLRLLERWRNRPLMPTIRFSTMGDLREHLLSEADALPRNHGETYHLFEGCFTTHAQHKRYNRACEQALLLAETLAAMLAKPTDARLREAWEGVMFNQFHDLLDGAAVPDAYADATARYHAAMESAGSVVEELLPDGPGDSFEIVNALPFARGELAELPAEPALTALRDTASGALLPVQTIDDAQVVWVPELPACGSRRLAPTETAPPPSHLHLTETPLHIEVETPFARWRVSRASGVIGSCLDTRTGRELVNYGVPKPLAHVPVTRLDLGLNVLEVIDEAPNPMSAWHINDLLRVERLLRGASVRVLATGPVCVRIEVTRGFRQSRLRQELRFYAATPRIDLLTEVDWREPSGPELGVPALKQGFNVSLTAPRVRHEGPFVISERPANGMETVSQSWSCVSGEEGGYAVYNRGIYGCDTLGGRHRLTLLRNAYGPDPCSDHGQHAFAVAFEPLTADADNATLMRRGASFNRPPLVRQGGETTMPAPFAIDNPSIVCTSWHPSDDGEATLLRLFESAGRQQSCTVSGLGQEAQLVDFLEAPMGGPIAAGATGLRLTFRPWEVKTLRIPVRQ